MGRHSIPDPEDSAGDEQHEEPQIQRFGQSDDPEADYEPGFSESQYDAPQHGDSEHLDPPYRAPEFRIRLSQQISAIRNSSGRILTHSPSTNPTTVRWNSKTSNPWVLSTYSGLGRQLRPRPAVRAPALRTAANGTVANGQAATAQ